VLFAGKHSRECQKSAYAWLQNASSSRCAHGTHLALYKKCVSLRASRMLHNLDTMIISSSPSICLICNENSAFYNVKTGMRLCRAVELIHPVRRFRTGCWIHYCVSVRVVRVLCRECAHEGEGHSCAEIGSHANCADLNALTEA
jgi:hypothetical protein